MRDLRFDDVMRSNQILLSEAQQRVFVLLVQGLSEKDIAGQLSLSPNTIHTHVRAIYRTFRVRSRAQLLCCLIPSGPGEQFDDGIPCI
jgi:DNA-binding NarL/FixJ family response regulator